MHGDGLVPGGFSQGTATIERYELNRTKRALVDAALVANEALNPALKKSIEALARELGVSKQFVTTRKRACRVRGDIAPTNINAEGIRVSSHRTNDDKPRVAGAIDTEKLLNEINSGKYVDRAERRRILSIIATFGKDSDKIQAVWKLEELDKQEEANIGTPAPKTSEERIERLTRLNLAAGQEEATTAFTRAFPSHSEAPTG